MVRLVRVDGGELNTLGRQKLDLMLAADRPNDPLIVYVDLATAAMRDPARASVRQYLEFRGLGESQVRVLDGINPSSARPTAEALRELSALENNQPPQAAAPQQTQTPGAPGLGQAPVANH